MQEAINLARKNLKLKNGGPFGAIVVKDGKIIGRGMNTVTSANDPTAHAEVNAIREACENLDSFQLKEAPTREIGCSQIHGLLSGRSSGGTNRRFAFFTEHLKVGFVLLIIKFISRNVKDTVLVFILINHPAQKAFEGNRKLPVS